MSNSFPNKILFLIVVFIIKFSCEQYDILCKFNLLSIKIFFINVDLPLPIFPKIQID